MAEMTWSPRAVDEFDEIRRYIAKSSESTSRQVVQDVLQIVEQIRSQPLSGNMVNEYNRADVRERLSGSYRIIYRVINDDLVEIVTIRRGARRLPRRLPF
jgi:toxin ParE1/3/4